MRKFILSIIFAALAGCASTTHNDQLYRDLGGQQGIEKLVDAFLDNLANDDRIFHFFKDTKIDHFRSMLIEQLCSLSGGPCKYTGETMEKSHGGMKINEAQFNALVEDLELAMEKEKISVGAQNRLIKILAPMRPQIIYQ